VTLIKSAMIYEVTIADEKVKNFTASAHDVEIEAIKTYATQVADEANRIEESRRNSTSSPEITGAMVRDSVFMLQNIGPRRKTTVGKTSLRVISYFTTLLTGGLFNIDKFSSTKYMLIFLSVFTACIFTTICVFIKDSNTE
jgi:hypothetical protein